MNDSNIFVVYMCVCIFISLKSLSSVVTNTAFFSMISLRQKSQRQEVENPSQSVQNAVLIRAGKPSSN